MATATAGPVSTPDDIGLRPEIQRRADYGVIRGPVTNCPLAMEAAHQGKDLH